MRPERASGRRRALLVHPWICDYAAYDFWIQPLGLLFTGGFLRSRGWRVDLVDALAGARESGRRRWDGTAPFTSTVIPDPLPLPEGGGRRRFRRYGVPADEFERRLARVARPDAILVSLQMTYWYPALETAIKALGRVHPGVPVFLGGGYASLLPEHAAARPGVRAVVSGRRPESAFARLCRLLGEPPPSAQEARRAPAAWDVCGEVPHAAVLTSWGCPFRCTYCATPRSFPGWHPRPAEVVAAELRGLAGRPRLRDLACYDDALLHRREEHFLPLAAALAKAGFGADRFRWHFPNGLHARWLDRPVVAALRDLGAATVWLGIESCDPVFQKEWGGKVAREDVERALAAFEAERFRPRHLGAYLLAGLPGLDGESVLRSMERLHALGLRVAVATFSPIPGTPEFERAATADPRLREQPLRQNNTRREIEAGAEARILRRRARELNARLDGRPPL